ncbi:MAG TPA: hypothetical protein VEA61_07300 [Allosphingosinicella sp.]|nr:hypothetical protein [Allosphingosinicella sp.]
MEAASPLFAALGVVEIDALDDLAGWFDGCVERMRTAEASPRAGRAAEHAIRAAACCAGREA